MRMDTPVWIFADIVVTLLARGGLQLKFRPPLFDCRFRSLDLR